MPRRTRPGPNTGNVALVVYNPKGLLLRLDVFSRNGNTDDKGTSLTYNLSYDQRIYLYYHFVFTLLELPLPRIKI